MDPMENAEDFIGRHIKSLAKLGVAAVSMGKYAVDIITAKNRPESNRMYSTDGQTEEPGFLKAADFGHVMRGSAKDFAPIGWCRWAINVGINEKHLMKNTKLGQFLTTELTI